MGVGAAGLLQDGLADELLLFGGQGLLEQLLQAGHEEAHRHLEDEKAHHQCGQGVEHAPRLAQQDGAANAHRRADARQGIAAVVPRVGHHGGRRQTAALTHRELEQDLLRQQREQRSREGDVAGLRQRAATQVVIDLCGRAVEYAQTHDGQHQPDEGRGEGLVLAVSILVVAVAGLAREAHEEDDHDVGDKVGEGVYGIGHHGRTAACHAGDKLEERQQEVDHTAPQRDTVDGALTLWLEGEFGFHRQNGRARPEPEQAQV